MKFEVRLDDTKCGNPVFTKVDVRIVCYLGRFGSDSARSESYAPAGMKCSTRIII